MSATATKPRKGKPAPKRAIAGARAARRAGKTPGRAVRRGGADRQLGRKAGDGMNPKLSKRMAVSLLRRLRQLDRDTRALIKRLPRNSVERGWLEHGLHEFRSGCIETELHNVISALDD